ncbi:MAG: coproporphyrinogen dehydrogenase HemZ, partial [Firmicutes bacterium]|nr:coproporphyrinogen dehydrogenase HemZ [Bacillota bacterium]
HMAGNFENVGWCLPGTESLYNIRIMEEDQTIVAMGAGAISKVYFPEENRLERVPNVSNYQIYIERIEEMIARKEAGLL